ncbi:MAG: YraN family protein [Bacteroidales bacterium]|nr:YraN family protein [Bacteroidales bacterium]MCI2121736.1 YraN family protein [Bacteroidales bacterium]MCI2145090.1 YraN family protein [Bacteroidales bacterium]
MWHNAATGRRGEDAAQEYLLRRGLVLRERNWRCGRLEVDLIMESPARLHIVEVKTLVGRDGRSAFDRVDGKKQGNLVNAARRYIALKSVAKEVQFDIVSVSFAAGEPEIEYVPDAFFPMGR